MKPKIIKTEPEYAEALARVESLMDAKPGTPKEEELELWSLLIERYEQQQVPIDIPDPVEAIKFRMEQEGLTPRDLEPYIGQSGRVSEVLNRKRPLSLRMVKRLHEGLKIPYESLMEGVQ
jgi:HTH-type transcriptional regulator/antitoxin HigA